MNKNFLSGIWNSLVALIKKRPWLWGTFAICIVIVAATFIEIYKETPITANISTEQTQAQSQTEVTNGTEKTFILDETEKISAELLERDIQINSLITSVKASKAIGDSIEPDTEFILTSKVDLDENNLKSLLSLNTDMSFNLTKTAECTYTLKSTELLPKGNVIQLVLRDDDGSISYKWAFQTVDTFKIKSVYPSNQSTYVSVDTGIEIEFTSNITINNIEEYFEITPNVNGEFKKIRNSLVFVPNHNLKGNTVYNVTLKEGLVSSDGIPLEEGISFQFRTRTEKNYIYFYARDGVTETFLPEDRVLTEIYCSSEAENQNVSLKLYQYNNYQEYQNELKNYIDKSTWYSEYEFPTDKLKPVYETNEQMQKYGYRSYLLLPENLEQGWYLADITMTYKLVTYHIQRLIQINTLSVYASVLPEQSAFFINDTVTGKAINGADITISIGDKTSAAKTTADGTAIVNTNTQGDGDGIVTIKYGDRVYTDILDNNNYNNYNYYDYYYYDYNNSYNYYGSEYTSNDFYTYLYTDREIYKTTDTINVWGMILPRTSKAPELPKDVSVFFGYEDEDGKRIPITLNEDGTFIAELSYQNYQKTWGNPIKIMIGDTIVYTKYLPIEDYVKPTYVFTTDSPVYAWMPQTNPVDVSIKSEYFDGTPSVNQKFDINSYYINDADPQNIVTDLNGYASSKITITDRNEWRPSNTSFYFKTTGIENETQSIYDNFYSIHRDVMLITDYKEAGSKSSLTFNAYTVDPTVISSKPSYIYYYHNIYDNDELKGKPTETEVTAVLHHCWNEKIANGSYYDFIDKVTKTRYRYDYHNDIIGTYTEKTVSGKGEFKNLPTSEINSTYYVELTWKDSLGQLVEEQIYLYDRNYSYFRENNYHNYILKADSNTFTENQSINFKLLDNSNDVAQSNARVFYAVNSTEFLYKNVTNAVSFDIKMTNDYIPNVNIRGAYFDGKHIFPVYSSNYTYYFDPKERALELTVISDKNKYSPGENANLTVKAKDLNGNIIPNAKVSLSLADEAVFAIKEQNADPLHDIYRKISLPSMYAYYSYIEHVLDENGMGEGGDGGDDYNIRSDFKDTAAFLTAVTNSDGVAVFNVKLPDNLTTWRATAQAVYEQSAGRIFAGASKSSIVCTQPLFIKPIMLPQYLSGDDITVSAFCDGLTDGTTPVTAQLTGNGYDLTAKAPAGSPLKFGKLPSGSYKVLFIAKEGTNTDAIELPLEIVDTLLEMEIVSSFDLANGIPEISPTRYPVCMTFYDKEYMLHSDILSIMTRSYGERLEYRIANKFASLEYGYIDEDYYKSSLSDVYSEKLLKKLSSAKGDYEISALVCVAAPELVNKEALIKQFYDYHKKGDTKVYTDELADCYLGLSALGEPILNEVMYSLEFYDACKQCQMKHCIALALLGDYDSALENYIRITEDAVYKASYTDNDKTLAYVDFGTEYIEIIKDTKLTLMAASILNLPEAEYMARYLCTQNQTDQTYVLELMTYLKYYSPKYDNNAEIEYTLNGKKVNVKLNHFRGHTIRFGEEQLKNADLKAVNGEVKCNIHYTGMAAENTGEQSIKVEKKYSVIGGSKFTAGALVKVEIKLPNKTSNESYIINDIIPTCARYSYSNDSSYVNRNGQKVTLYIHNLNTVTYYIRLVNVGEFVTENTVVQDYYGNWGMSERSKINVEGNETNA